VRRIAWLLALVVLALPAAAYAKVDVRHVDTRGYPKVRVTVVTGKATKVAPTLRENGKPPAGLQSENLGRAKSIVLALDNSRSMRGEALQNAITAARTFVKAKGPQDQIAIVVFGSKAIQYTGFTSATIDADIALRNIDVDKRQGTALHDAIVLSGNALQSQQLGSRVIVVVTDGTDVSSTK